MKKSSKLNLELDSDNYSKINSKLDNIIQLMDSALQELKKLNNYNAEKMQSQSLFNPFG